MKCLKCNGSGHVASPHYWGGRYSCAAKRVKEAISMEEYKEILGNEFCDFCPWKENETEHEPDNSCEEKWCDEAFENFMEENKEFLDDED